MLNTCLSVLIFNPICSCTMHISNESFSRRRLMVIITEDLSIISGRFSFISRSVTPFLFLAFFICSVFAQF